MSATAAPVSDAYVEWATVVVPAIVGSSLTAGLSQRERQALYYHQVRGLSYRDTARLIGVGEGPARMYVSRALARLSCSPAAPAAVRCQATLDTRRGA